MKKDTLLAVKKYKKLFRKYDPKNQERIEEYETYIVLADKYNKNFGGKKSLYKLIPLIAPYWKYKKQDSDLLKLYNKYDIDSTNIEEKIKTWKKNLNKSLIDSFSIGFVRDQMNFRTDSSYIKNDEKNAKLLEWTFINYGFPSLQKIGLYGDNNIFMPMNTFIDHLSNSSYFPYLKIKLLEYVKSGDCTPKDYATFIDRQSTGNNGKSLYGAYQNYYTVIDSVEVNSNRKSIGLPSLNHAKIISKDFFKK